MYELSSNVYDACSGSWMTCLSGAVIETQYAVPPAAEDPELLTPRSPATRPLVVPGVVASLAPCPPLRRGRTATLLPGQTAYISDEIVRSGTPQCCHAVLLVSARISVPH